MTGKVANEICRQTWIGGFVFSKVCGVLILVALTVACQSDRRSNRDVERFFSSRIGKAADAGLFQQGAVSGQWDLVGVIHSMTDDLGFCQTIVEALKAQRNANTYSCRLLN
jgi:hypothetical protein